MSQEYAAALGRRLRAVRRQRGLTLQQVEEQSEGRWTVEAVGSYERARRAVTVTRLAELAEFYGLTTAELLPARPATTAPSGGGRFTVDLDRLADLPARQGGPLARYASAIQQHRGDHGGTLLTIREQDLQSLAVIYDMEPEALTAMLLHSGVLTIDATGAQHPGTGGVGKASTDRSEGHGTAAPGDG